MLVGHRSDPDVFICHASEDKKDVAVPLVEGLKERHISTWIDVERLTIGDRLRPSVDAALTRCEFAAVVLSPFFFEKVWTRYELEEIMYRSMDDSQVMLPILHNMTRKDMLRHAPFMKGKVSRSTADFSITQIAEEIARVIHAADPSRYRST